jgi:hypothetical protein
MHRLIPAVLSVLFLHGCVRSAEGPKARHDVPGKKEAVHENRIYSFGEFATDFIEAVSWCAHPLVRKALEEIEKRTDDPDILEALRKGR